MKRLLVLLALVSSEAHADVDSLNQWMHDNQMRDQMAASIQAERAQVRYDAVMYPPAQPYYDSYRDPLGSSDALYDGNQP